MQNDTPAQKLPTPPNDLSPADVRKTLSRINPRNMPGRVLKDCAEQLTDVLMDIFNISEPGSHPHMNQIHNNHTGTKEITCVLSKRLPFNSTDSNHNEVLWEASHAQHQNQHPQHTQSAPVCIPPKPPYGWCNFLHLALTHLENKDSYVRMLFIDFISAFNTIIPQLLINKLNLLGLNNSLCNWIVDFLTGRPQSVRVGHNTSSTTTLRTGAPQDCVLSPLLFTLLTHDCTAKFSSNHIIKFGDDTPVVGLISNNDETHYREEVAQLAERCGANNLSLNVGRTKEVVMDFRRNSVDHPPPPIDHKQLDCGESQQH